MWFLYTIIVIFIISGQFPVGQNIAWTSLYDWQFTLTAWHNEHKNFRYGYGSTNGEPIGHYTQVRDNCYYIFVNQYTNNCVSKYKWNVVKNTIQYNLFSKSYLQYDYMRCSNLF